ncbi:MAG: tetratricopeptide repeat protein, partial [Thermodesulfobacteriota bacterium]
AILAMNPQRGDVYNNLGVIYAQLGSLNQAIMAFQEALRLKPDDPRAQQNLERALRIKGQR